MKTVRVPFTPSFSSSHIGPLSEKSAPSFTKSLAGCLVSHNLTPSCSQTCFLLPKFSTRPSNAHQVLVFPLNPPHPPFTDFCGSDSLFLDNHFWPGNLVLGKNAVSTLTFSPPYPQGSDLPPPPLPLPLHFPLHQYLS